MSVPPGNEVYNCDAQPVRARGHTFTPQELHTALGGPVAALLRDDPGMAQLEAVLSSAVATEFALESLQRIVHLPPVTEEWRVGEAFAEAYLVEHQQCHFPWPTGRDLRNPNASPAGTDLVGFQCDGDADVPNRYRFAFGEVKTSSQQLYPPNVMFGRHGLINQLENLMQSNLVKDALVRYLFFHSQDSNWTVQFQSAISRYLENAEDISLFGVLVREVSPNVRDLRSRANTLALTCPVSTSICLQAMYLPDGITLRGTLDQIQGAST